MPLDIRYCEKNSSYYVVETSRFYRPMRWQLQELNSKINKLKSRYERALKADPEAKKLAEIEKLQKQYDELREKYSREKWVYHVNESDVPEGLHIRPLYDPPEEAVWLTEAGYEELLEKLMEKAERRKSFEMQKATNA